MNRLQKLEILHDFGEYVFTHDYENKINDSIGCKNLVSEWFKSANLYRECMLHAVENFPWFLKTPSNLLDAELYLWKFFNV